MWPPSGENEVKCAAGQCKDALEEFVKMILHYFLYQLSDITAGQGCCGGTVTHSGSVSTALLSSRAFQSGAGLDFDSAALDSVLVQSRCGFAAVFGIIVPL